MAMGSGHGHSQWSEAMAQSHGPWPWPMTMATGHETWPWAAMTGKGWAGWPPKGHWDTRESHPVMILEPQLEQVYDLLAKATPNTIQNL